MRLSLICRAVPLLAVTACAVVAKPVQPPGGAPSATMLVIAGARIVDAEAGTASAPSDIIIDGDRIAAIAPAGASSLPAGTRTIDGNGRFVMSGLIDVHAHVGSGGVAPPRADSRERALRQFLRYGVTSIFVPGAGAASDADFPGLRERCRSAAATCPDLFGSGSLITALGSHPVTTIFQMPADTPHSVTEARGVTVLRAGMDIDALIAAKAAAGVDAIKIVIEDGPRPWYPKPRLTNAQIAALVAAAHARNLPVVAHVSMASHVGIALDAGVDAIMHAPTDRLSDALVERMARQRMWYVPTFALYDGILTWARKQRETDPYAVRGVDPAAIESLTAAPFLAAAAEDEETAVSYIAHASDNLKRAAAAGVRIAMGSDVNNPFVFPGFSAHEELSYMVRAGLSPAQALRSATVGSAEFVRSSTRLGRVAPGYEADLVVLAANPLDRIENSRRIVAVISNGQPIADPVSSE